MFRPASRSLLRTAQISSAPARTVSGRRFLTTEPPHLRSRSWKNSAARWCLAAAGIYFYNTSPAFADEPAFSPIEDGDDALEDTSPLSLDSIPRRETIKQRQALASATGTTPADLVSTSHSSREISTDPSSSSPADLEEEASSEGAFNPETGEINWDCPCLGGMAHGPCGEDFKGAFSCFVFSKEEPKGMDCIDNFKKMQDCFREHPDVYAGELADDDDEFEEGSEMAEERAELAKEVQERRRALQEKQTQGEADMPQKRLLEESPASPRPARKTASKTAPGSQKAKLTQRTQEGVQSPASSEPHPGMAEEHEVADLERRETMSEGAPSRLSQKPAPAPVQGKVEERIEKFDEGSELVPKAWHDAQDAGVPSDRKEKK